MKPKVAKVKNARGRITGYRASLCGLSAEGATKQEALAALDVHLRDTVARFAVGTTIGQWAGHTYVVSPSVDGYQTWVDVYSRTDYSVASCGPRGTAIISALRSIAQQIWTHDTDDEALYASLPDVDGRAELIDELRSYLSWQRNYKRYRDVGYDDQMARDLIAGFVTPAQAEEARKRLAGDVPKPAPAPEHGIGELHGVCR